MLGQNVAVLVQHLLHNVGLIEIAAVDAGRLSPDQLNRCHVEGLAEGVGRQRHHLRVEALFILKNALHLTDHVDAGLIHQTEGFQILVVGLRSHGQAHADKGRVAGMAHRLDEGLLTVAAVVGTVDGLVPALHTGGAGTVEGGVFRHLALLQRRRQRNGLIGGTRLVGGVDALVAPLGLNSAVDGRRPGLGIRLLRFIGGALCVDLGKLRIQLGFQGIVKNRAVVIQIVVGIGRHGHDSSGVHIHNDAGAAVFGAVFFQHTLQSVFQTHLDVGIQRQHQTVPVFRIEDLLVVVHQFRAGGVSGTDGIPGSTGKGIVVLGLQTHTAHAVGVYKAQNAGSQRSVQVVPLGGWLEPDALKLYPIRFRHLIAVRVDLAVDETANFVGNRLIRPLLDIPIVIVGLGHPGFQSLLFHAQNAAEALGDVGLIPQDRGCVSLSLIRRLLGGLLLLFLLALHKLRDPHWRDVYVLRRGGDGQRVEVSVINGASGGVDHGAAGLLLDGFFLQYAVLTDLDVIELPEQHCKGHDAQQQHDQHRPAADDLIGPPGRVAFSPGIGCHRVLLSGAIQQRRGVRRRRLLTPRCVTTYLFQVQSKYSTTA